MFAPRPEVVASEMFRVVKPGGAVAMAAYGPEGYLGRLSELIGRFSTQPTPGIPSPFLWGNEAEVRRRLRRHAAAIEVEMRTLRLEFASFEDWRGRFANANPPLMAMRRILPPPAHQRLLRDAWALAGELNVAPTGIAVESGYLAVVARKPPP
jgi:hypothetical protein